MKKTVFSLIIIFVILVGVIYNLSPLKTNVIVSGSMEPVLMTNSLVFTNTDISFDDIEKGDIICYNNVNIERNIMHRVYQVSYIDGEKIIMTKGDNLGAPDPWTVKESDYKGKIVGGINIVKPLLDCLYGNVLELNTTELRIKVFAMSAILVGLCTVGIISFKKRNGGFKYESK
ncbi:signal peptidase I [Sinanaerobacter sp. ZZT-01]|uniref:signal peptidase I n=1 Tax=Sinanaerobacter sp. ZZT-01 TaxID=3111540 RepID=UPI002D777229|nr:signal peptidase I [Sinanaerobacter sp. ZZT-01]WRR92722.1 signal peptidase I [Sinanaerobacter sp. ZZT-01]